MTVTWVSEDEGSHSAERGVGSKGVLHLAVESLGETGWDWHVWDVSGLIQQRYGLADTLAEAKEKAERALDVLAHQLDQVD